MTADYVDHEAPPGTPAGPEGANAVLRWLRGAFDDLSYEILDAFADGDRVAMRVATRGTHTGEFMGKARHRQAVRRRVDPHLPDRERKGRRALGQARRRRARPADRPLWAVRQTDRRG